MGLDYLCFSTVESLRCSGISRTQRILLLVPPAAQVVSALFLARSPLGHSREKHRLLFIEAFLSFALSVGDLALSESSRSIAEGSTSLNTFNLADRALAAISPLPLSFYGAFILLYLSASVLPFMPSAIHTFVLIGLCACVPLFITTDEMGGLMSVHNEISHGLVLRGYLSATDQRHSYAYKAVAFTALVTFQFAAILLLAYLLQHIRRIQVSGGSIPGTERCSTRWIMLGIVLGFLESSIGFAGKYYTVIILRKIALAGSRAMLIYGLTENVHFSKRETPFLRCSGSSDRFTSLPIGNPRIARGAISNPRYSTFVHLRSNSLPSPIRPPSRRRSSPHERMLHASYGGPTHSNPALRPIFPQPPIVLTVADSPEGRRVTVTVDQGGEVAPKLNVRFSRDSLPTVDRALALASDEDISESPPTRKLSIKANQGLYRFRPEYFTSPIRFPSQTLPIVRNSFEDEPTSAHTLHRSLGASEYDDAYELEALHDIMRQFPNTPISFTGTHPNASHSSLLRPASREDEDPFSDGMNAVPCAQCEGSAGTRTPSSGHADAVDSTSSGPVQPSMENGTQCGAPDGSPFSGGFTPERIGVRHRRVTTTDPESLFLSSDCFVEQRQPRKEHSASASQPISRLSLHCDEWHARSGTLDTSSRNRQGHSLHPPSAFPNAGTVRAPAINMEQNGIPGSCYDPAMGSSMGQVEGHRTSPETIDGSVYANNRSSLVGVEIGYAV